LHVTSAARVANAKPRLALPLRGGVASKVGAARQRKANFRKQHIQPTVRAGPHCRTRAKTLPCPRWERTGNTIGVGRACTESFVSSFIAIIILNFIFAEVSKDMYIAIYGIRSIFG